MLLSEGQAAPPGLNQCIESAGVSRPQASHQHRVITVLQHGATDFGGELVPGP